MCHLKINNMESYLSTDGWLKTFIRCTICMSKFFSIVLGFTAKQCYTYFTLQYPGINTNLFNFRMQESVHALHSH